MSPFVLRWNAGVNAERQTRIAAAFGDPSAAAGDLADAFISSLGMPRSLSAVDVGEDRFQAVAEYTMKDIWGRTNPRTISQPRDVMEILEMAR